VLFPGTKPTFHIGRKSSVALLESLAPGDALVVLTQKDARKVDVDADDLHAIGTLATVVEIEPRSDGQYALTLEGVRRAKLEGLVAHDPHLEAKVTILEERHAHADEAKKLGDELAAELGAETDGEAPGAFVDRMASKLDLPLEDKIELLAENDVVARLRLFRDRFVEHAKEDDGGASKKERVLHTRVPAVLERELKRLAESLRVPVSNLVRAVLEDAVAVADAAGEGVESRLKRFAKNLEEERDRLKRRVQRDPLANVFAFQPVKLAVAAVCARCETKLARGQTAYFGLADAQGGKNERVFVCDACLPKD
jgi:hypothetical protein